MSKLLLLYLLLVAAQHLQATAGEEVSSCRKLDAEEPDGSHRIICVCNATSCDYLDFDWPQQQNQVVVIESSEAGKRFRLTSLGESNESSGAEVEIRVNLSETHQTILGWGGSFTDSFGYNLVQLNSKEASLGDQIIKSYFGRTGLQYNFARVPIGGADFSLRTYSYDDTENDVPDYELEKWALQEEDYKYKIGPIKTALQMMANVGPEEQLKLIGSPWSPPKWMKTSKNFTRGRLIDDDRIYRSYANYLVKFYKSYAEEGIKFWGGTIQNEPLSAFSSYYYFNSLQFGYHQMAKFISEYLGPALEAHNFIKDNFKLIVGDDSLSLINAQVALLLANEKVQKYVSGVGYHWYLSNVVGDHETLSYLHQIIGNKSEFTLMTEACEGWLPGAKKRVDLGSWQRGESYAHDIITDLEHHTNGWIDWNMALDMQGGPNWANNFVDSPIIVNASAGEFYKQPMYYVLGHFSRFFRPGSVRVGTSYLGPNAHDEKVLASAVYNNQTGHLSVNLLNRSKDRIKVKLVIESTGGENVLRPVIDSKSITSLVIKM